MSDMLSIGASGLRAYQSALTTTSENIANAGNAGYVRRSTTVREVAAPGIAAAGTNGMGVVANGIARADDGYRAGTVRATTSELAKTEAGITWLERIESTLAGNKLGDQLTAFFTAGRKVAADPASLAPRAAMLEAAAGVASSFAATGAGLEAAEADLDAAAGAAVVELNGLTAALAKVNSGLGRSSPGTSAAASLLDQRDQLLEQMSALTDIAVTLDSSGRAIVRGGNGGPVLVEGDQAFRATFARNDEGAVAFTVLGEEPSALLPGGGALAGLGDGAQRLAASRAEIEALASGFAAAVNALQATGHDLNGTPGKPLFAVGDPPSRLSVVLADPKGIAAAATGGGARDNANMAALEALRTSKGFENEVSALTAANAGALSARQTVAEAQGAMRDGAVAARTSASGVNIDEEAVDLIRFQQAYQASSRVIQIARETLQTLFEIR
jgi:flagellar hook-associated protein 1 FlgK